MHFHNHHGWGPGYAFGRRGGFGPGRGGFGRGFMGGPMGGALRFGRMMADGDLRLIALALLEKGPRHGYDIIKALEERSGGFYSPSPGVVYPTLTFLEEAGYTSAEADGNKKVYSITESGRAYLDQNRESAESILEQMERFGRKMHRAREWFDWASGSQGPMPDRPGDPRDQAEMTDAEVSLDKARRRLRSLIAVALEGTEDEKLKVAEILSRAADEILGKTPGSRA